MRVRMRVVAGPGDLAELTGGDPSRSVVMTGSGPNDFVCGGCGTVLLEGMHLGQVEAVVVRCAACRAWNQVPGSVGGD